MLGHICFVVPKVDHLPVLGPSKGLLRRLVSFWSPFETNHKKVPPPKKKKERKKERKKEEETYQPQEEAPPKKNKKTQNKKTQNNNKRLSQLDGAKQRFNMRRRCPEIRWSTRDRGLFSVQNGAVGAVLARTWHSLSWALRKKGDGPCFGEHVP